MVSISRDGRCLKIEKTKPIIKKYIKKRNSKERDKQKVNIKLKFGKYKLNVTGGKQVNSLRQEPEPVILSGSFFLL